MGGMMSRQKGKSGEREIAALLTVLTGFDVRRKVRQHAGDSDIEGVDGWEIEAKRYAAASPAVIKLWWRQAVEQAARTGAKPVLFFRLDRGNWCAVWQSQLHKSPRPTAPSTDFDDTLNATPSTWWDLVRGLS